MAVSRLCYNVYEESVEEEIVQTSSIPSFGTSGMENSNNNTFNEKLGF
jgi:aminopeptidase N